MNHYPLVSIIIPAYKADNYIQEALDSVHNQTYPNWEVIVVEDAWKDRTEEIVQQFSAQVGENRVKFLRHEVNQGLAATRNTGIAIASGEYIALLDHDDIWLPEYLTHLIAALELNQSDFAYSGVTMFNETVDELWICAPNEDDLNNFPASLFYHRNFITPSATVIRRAVFDKIGFFNAGLRSCEDYEFWLRCARANCTFSYVTGNLCRYRKHGVSLSNDSEVMSQTLLSVIKQNLNWEIVPYALKCKRLVGVYRQIIYVKASKSIVDTLSFVMQEWWESPIKVQMVKTSLKAIATNLLKPSAV